jgi:hypothetical protein
MAANLKGHNLFMSASPSVWSSPRFWLRPWRLYQHSCFSLMGGPGICLCEAVHYLQESSQTHRRYCVTPSHCYIAVLFPRGQMWWRPGGHHSGTSSFPSHSRRLFRSMAASQDELVSDIGDKYLYYQWAPPQDQCHESFLQDGKGLL